MIIRKAPKKILSFLLGILAIQHLFSSLIHAVELNEALHNPVAHPDAIVVFHNIRISVLTPRLVRIELAKSSSQDKGSSPNNEASSFSFEDRPTMAFLNRLVSPIPKFSHVTNGDNDRTLVLETDYLRLTFDASNFPVNSLTGLTIESTQDTFKTYKYGTPNAALPGAVRCLESFPPGSMDCADVGDKKVSGELTHCTMGLISRTNGWVMWNDTSSPKFTEGTDWWDISDAGKEREVEDLYFFGHGLDYKAALNDYVQVGGRIPMLPKYALGHWWTRWYDFDASEVLEMIDDMRMSGLPLDVFIFDMNWHSKQYWGGFAWDTRLYPSPEDLQSLIHERGIKTAGNIHDADGVGKFEPTHAKLAQTLHRSPDEDIHFTACVDKDYAYGVENIVLGAIKTKGNEKNGTFVPGFDFWWTDYQQGGTQGGCVGGEYNPTTWTNKIRSTSGLRNGENKRQMVLARWGGLGNHRYPVGFSGDVVAIDWTNFAFQPLFGSTGANVGYGFWSHDTHAPVTDLELYVRWVQANSVSAIMRSHERGYSAGGCAEDTFPGGDLDSQCTLVKPWDLPEMYRKPVREALRRRYEWFPYLYNNLRVAHDSGLSLTRPMYYDSPQCDMAYASTPDGNYAQYMLGDDVLVAPIVRPASSSDAYMAKKEVWVPQGKWVEYNSGVIIDNEKSKCGRVLLMEYNLNLIPTFVRAGTVLPLRNMERTLREGIVDIVGETEGKGETNAIVFEIQPGSAKGEGYWYSDDGSSLDYLRGADKVSSEKDMKGDSPGKGYTNSTVNYEWSEDKTGLKIAMAVEAFASDVHVIKEENDRVREKKKSTSVVTGEVMQDISFMVLDSLPPSTVEVRTQLEGGGEKWLSLPYSRTGEWDSWSYDSRRMGVLVRLGKKHRTLMNCPVVETGKKGRREGSDGIRGNKERLESGNVDGQAGNICTGEVQVSMLFVTTGLSSPQQTELFSGVRGLFRNIRPAKERLDQVRQSPGSQTGQMKDSCLLELSSSGMNIELAVSRGKVSDVLDVLKGLSDKLACAKEEVGKLNNDKDAMKMRYQHSLRLLSAFEVGKVVEQQQGGGGEEQMMNNLQLFLDAEVMRVKSLQAIYIPGKERPWSKVENENAEIVEEQEQAGKENQASVGGGGDGEIVLERHDMRDKATQVE